MGVFRIDNDSFSLLSQHDLSYADFSHVVDDEDNSVCSLLTYSTIPTVSESNNSLDSKIETNSGILSGTIHITQIMKENMNTNFDIQREKSIETQEQKVVSRIEELQRRKRSMEEKYTSSIISSRIKIDEKIDELNLIVLFWKNQSLPQ